MMVAQQQKCNQYQAPLRASVKGSRKRRNCRRIAISPMTKIALAGLVIALLLLTYVTEKNMVMTYSYQLAELENQLEKAMVQRDRLGLEVRGLKSLDRIDSVARAKLGMVQPATVKYVALAPSQDSVGSPPGTERVVNQIAEYISGLLTSVVKAAGLYEGR